MLEEQSDFEPGEALDRFRLEKLLGAGAFGEVWLAMDEGEHGFRKRVALKILSRDQSERRLNALIREARICGALNHPNIVDVYGVMQIERCSFIIMEYVDGETLAAMWRDLEYLGLRFPRATIVDVGIAVAEALYHAWKAVDAEGQPLKIVHRDLKPANVMVSDRGVVKVADFGIAKVAPDVSVTRQGKLKGTPSYMAPELWSGTRDFRPSIDLWSLGVILWEMATGLRFFGKASIAEIFDLAKSRAVEDELAQIGDYFIELKPILRKLLQRNPDRRPQSALQVAEELRALRHGLGPSGDLLQFGRLLRAGRLEPDQREGSLAILPALPPGVADWEPLVAVARGKEVPVADWDKDSIPPTPLRIGPEDLPSLDPSEDATGPSRRSLSGGAIHPSLAAEPPTSPGTPPGLRHSSQLGVVRMPPPRLGGEGPSLAPGAFEGAPPSTEGVPPEAKITARHPGSLAPEQPRQVMKPAPELAAALRGDTVRTEPLPEATEAAALRGETVRSPARPDLVAAAARQDQAARPPAEQAPPREPPPAFRPPEALRTARDLEAPKEPPPPGLLAHPLLWLVVFGVAAVLGLVYFALRGP